MIKTIEEILKLSEKRVDFLHNKDNKDWYKGYETYIDGVEDEFEEMKVEIRDKNKVYLEDELGDVFWDYLCLVNSLDQDGLIEKEKVFSRCLKKFRERLGEQGEGGKNWEEVKQKQKAELKKEHNNLYN